MSKEKAVDASGLGTKVVGATPSGLTKKVVSSIGRSIKTAFDQDGRVVVVKGLRFIPSSRVDLGGGTFQVMANTVVEVAASRGAPGRARSVDSVVTVGREGGTGQVLKGVKIPELDRLRA